MAFIPLLILGIIFYFSDKRVWSALIFFFFVCDGFQLVPLFLFDTGLIVNKPNDFAILYIIIIFLLGIVKYKDFLVVNRLSKSIAVFTAFIIISCFISRYIYQVPWEEIIRTARIYFFVLAYFVFRRYQKRELLLVFRLLFYITSFLCTLYVIQSIIGIPILTGASRIGSFGKINRYYNIPTFYYYFIFYSFFFSPLKGYKKYFNILIYILVSIVSLHRGLMIGVCFVAFLGIYFQGGFKGIIKYVFIGTLIITPFAESLFSRFADNTNKDVNSVMEGAFQDYGNEISIDGTFLFRIALFYERLDYIVERPLNMVFGVGFMAEGSNVTMNTFDFKIGLQNEATREVVQLDTADISWVNLILRLGFFGTLLYLLIMFTAGKQFFRQRKDPLQMTGILYILLLFFNSLTSYVLWWTLYILPILLLYIVQEINEKQTKEALEE